MRYERMLVLAPHTDDAELGCGGTIARFLEDGVKVSVAAFSTAEESLPPGAPASTLRDEFVQAMYCLGVDPKNTLIYDYPVRKLSYHRQEVLEELIRLRRETKPDIVVVPSGSDLHQDHQVLYVEGVRAYKDMTLIGYELPWNHIGFSAQVFVVLEKRHLQLKWSALQAYKSQLQLTRPYFTLEFIEGLARVRGVQVKSTYAEAFESVRIRL